jgi:hypothetical protein
VRRLPVGLVTKIILLLSLMSSGQRTHDNRIVRDRFLGARRLVWLEELDEMGKSTNLTARGCLCTRGTGTCRSR